jgi:hypothetical protein
MSNGEEIFDNIEKIFVDKRNPEYCNVKWKGFTGKTREFSRDIIADFEESEVKPDGFRELVLSQFRKKKIVKVLGCGNLENELKVILDCGTICELDKEFIKKNRMETRMTAYSIERILGGRKEPNGNLSFLVKWSGYPLDRKRDRYNVDFIRESVVKQENYMEVEGIENVFIRTKKTRRNIFERRQKRKKNPY